MRGILLSLCVAAAAHGAHAAERPPNVVLIVADDLGWKDVGYHDSEIETPQLDRLARDGIELDRFYVQPSCSPTRTALLTGMSPARMGMDLTDFRRGALPTPRATR